MKKYEFILSIDGVVILNRSGNRLQSVRKRFYRAIRKTANSLDEITKDREIGITFRNDKETKEYKFKIGEIL